MNAITESRATPIRAFRLAAVLASSIGLLSGCVSRGPDLVRTGRIAVESRGLNPGRLMHVGVTAGEDLRVRVSGKVAFRNWLLGPSGHLDLELVSEAGALLGTAQAKLRRTRGGGPVRSRNASFDAWLTLSEPVPQQCVLRVAYHGAKHESDPVRQ